MSLNLSFLKNKCIPALLLGLGLLTLSVQSYGQRVYADAEQHSDKQVVLVTLSEVTDTLKPLDSANLNDFSTLNVTLNILGLLGNPAWQNLQFTGPVSQKPNLNSPVTLKFKGNTAVLSLLNNIRIRRTSGGDDNGVDSTYTGSNLLDLLGLFSADSTEYTLPAPGVAYDGVQLKIGGLVSAAMQAYYYYAFFIVEPLIENDTICSGETATLTIPNFQSGAQWKYLWYSDATGTTAVDTTTSASIDITPALNNGTSPTDTFLYVEAVQIVGGKSYKSARRTVTIRVNSIPTAPIMDDFTLCSGVSATIPITNHNAAFQYDVYDAATLGNPLFLNIGGSFSHSGINNPSGSAPVVSNYFVSAQDNSTSCVSIRAKVTITTDAQAPNPVVTIE